MQLLAPTLRAVLSLAALGAIGVGAWQIFPPAALIAVGGLVWLDLREDKPE